MKNLFKGVVVCLLILLAAGGMVAAEGSIIEEGINKTAGDLEVPRGMTVNGDVTVNMGETVILGTVNGNVSGNIGQITVHGDVNGDVDANMGQVHVTGNVSGNVKARMGEVIIDGTVAGNVNADLGSVRIMGTVGGDVYTGLGELRIPGEVLGNVNSRGGNIYITGTVEGDVTLNRGIIDLGPRAVVRGRVYVKEGLVRAAEGASTGSIKVVTELTEEELRRRYHDSEGYTYYGVEGIIDNIVGSLSRAFRDTRIPTVRYIIMENIQHWSPWRWFYIWPGSLARGLFNMIVLFALSALTFSLFPRQVQHTGSAVMHKTGTVFGWGLLAALLAIPLMVLLVLTIIGIPLIVVEVLFLAVAALLGYTAIAHIIGDRIVSSTSSGKANPLGAIALGVLIVGIVSMVPLIGWIASLAVYIVAVGAALTTRFGTAAPHADGTAVITVPAVEQDGDDAAEQDQETIPEEGHDQ